jgi:hypothetical protein
MKMMRFVPALQSWKRSFRQQLPDSFTGLIRQPDS